MLEACQDFGVIVQAYSPLGNGNMSSRSHYFDNVSEMKIGKIMTIIVIVMC